MAHAMPATAGLAPAAAPAVAAPCLAVAAPSRPLTVGGPAALRPVPAPAAPTPPATTKTSEPTYGAVAAVILTVALLMLVGSGVRAQHGSGVSEGLGAPAAAAPDPSAASWAATGWTGGTPLTGAAGAPVESPAAGGTVVVRPGDTIWDLARQAVPAGVALEDYVADVVVRNDIDPHRLVPGSTLQLP